MSLTLDDREAAVLKQALDNYLPQLRTERTRAEARDIRHALTLLEDALESIRKKL